MLQRAGAHVVTMQQSSQSQSKRAICQRCERPANTCLCASLPLAGPMHVSGHVLVLRHPNEKKKRMATIPVLEKCLQDLTVIHSRTLKTGLDAKFDAVLSWAVAGGCPLYLLYPGPDATALEKASSMLQHAQEQPGSESATNINSGLGDQGSQQQRKAASPATPSQTFGQASPASQEDVVAAVGHVPAWVLLSVDGTWREAKEMSRSCVNQLMPPVGTAVKVTLPGNTPNTTQQAGGSQPVAMEVDGLGDGDDGVQGLVHEGTGDGDRQTKGAGVSGSSAAEVGACLIRKEPMEGYLTTYEAISYAVATLEGDQQLLQQLLAPLRAMTRYQARHDPAVAARCQWATVPEASEVVQTRCPQCGQVSKERMEQ